MTYLAGDRKRDQRIRRIQEILLNSVVGREMADDGDAEPRMILTVRYENDSEEETFLFASREGSDHLDVEICSPDSPLGRPVSGAQERQRRQYRMPKGHLGTVQLVRAVPVGRTPAPS